MYKPTQQTEIGLGLAAIGRPEYINIRTKQPTDKSEQTFRENAMQMLDLAYKKGVRYFDTAPSYGKGEAFLLDWYQHNQLKNVRLGTKWGYTYVADWQLGHQGAHEIKEHSLAKLQEQWAVSQNLLPALSFYQIHSATFESGVLENQEVLERLAEIKSKYGVRIGLTTSGANQKEVIQKALDISVAGHELFDSIQSTFTILEHDTLSILQAAMQAGKTVIVKEALANGRVFPNPKYPHYADLYASLQTLAERHAVGIDAVALRFVMDVLQPNIVLSGAAEPNQLEQNLMANTFALSEEELNTLKTHRVAAKTYWDERAALGWG